jgi:hypothetical protein
MEHFGLGQSGDGFGERVITGVADAAEQGRGTSRRRDARTRR